jgi:hypothetical protein
VPWVTGMVLCWEEQTITQMLTSLELESRWRVLAHVAEYGAWDRQAVEPQTFRLLEQERPARWGRYHPVVRLSCRLSQWPAGDTFRTKTALAVERLHPAEAASKAPILGIVDGAYAVDTVVKPCLEPEPGQRRLAIVTRLRMDARRSHPVGPQSPGKGRPAKGAPRIAAPQHHVH